MRLGRVYFSSSYVVDLDDPDMVAHAKDAVYEDICSANKYDEMGIWIKADAAPDASPNDIPEFLLDNEE
jgi:hypothetical protein